MRAVGTRLRVVGEVVCRARGWAVSLAGGSVRTLVLGVDSRRRLVVVRLLLLLLLLLPSLLRLLVMLLLLLSPRLLCDDGRRPRLVKLWMRKTLLV
jgi:hypothetical protein